MPSLSRDRATAPHRLRNVAVAALLILPVLAIYVLRLDHVAGIIGDDAWYVVLAKAIARGDGPRVISSAGVHFLSQVYPPGFPALLSLVFLINPNFPDNLFLLKSVAIAAMIAAGLLTYRYAAHDRGLPRPLALAVALATVLTPALVFLATSTVMSEPVFVVVQLAAVLLLDRAVRAGEDRRGLRFALLAGLVAAAAFLIRTAGMTIGAAGLFLFVYHRRWRSAGVFAATAVLSLTPWWLYAHANAPTRAQLVDHGGMMAVAYSDQFWTTEAGNIEAWHTGIGALPSRIVRNLTNIAVRDVGGVLVPTLFRTAGESGLEVIGLGPPEGMTVPSMGTALGANIVSLALTGLAVLGFITGWRRRPTAAEPLVVLTLGMIALWPFWTFRFVLPMAPFLLCYVATGADRLARALGDGRRPTTAVVPSAVRILFFVLIGLNVLDHARYIAQTYGAPRGGPWKAGEADVDEVLDFIQQHATLPGTIATDNPALVYLRTGRPTVAVDSFTERWSRWQRMGVRYVASLSNAGALIDDPRAKLLFKLPDKNIWVFELVAPGR